MSRVMMLSGVSLFMTVLSTAALDTHTATFGLLGVSAHARSAAPAVAEAAQIVEVDIESHKFRPAAVTVPVGTTIKWVNHDEEVHTVTSTTGAFTSRGLHTAETFTSTLTTPGMYTYFCAVHPVMTAQIIVK